MVYDEKPWEEAITIQNFPCAGGHRGELAQNTP